MGYLNFVPSGHRPEHSYRWVPLNPNMHYPNSHFNQSPMKITHRSLHVLTCPRNPNLPELKGFSLGITFFEKSGKYLYTDGSCSGGSRGLWRPGPPCPQDFFKIMQLSSNFKGKPHFEPILGSGPPLGSKLRWAPLAKILDRRLSCPWKWTSSSTLEALSFCLNTEHSISPSELCNQSHKLNLPKVLSVFPNGKLIFVHTGTVNSSGAAPGFWSVRPRNRGTAAQTGSTLRSLVPLQCVSIITENTRIWGQDEPGSCGSKKHPSSCGPILNLLIEGFG